MLVGLCRAGLSVCLPLAPTMRAKYYESQILSFITRQSHHDDHDDDDDRKNYGTMVVEISSSNINSNSIMSMDRL